MLRESKGNMYSWVSHQKSTIKGKCYFDCSYCFMKQWGELRPIRFDERELSEDLGSGRFIFINDSCDMFADNIPDKWISDTLNYCMRFPDNKYLLQTKNPGRVLHFLKGIEDRFVVCTTIETNRQYFEHMGNAPSPEIRAMYMNRLKHFVKTYVTIEPIMDFDLEDLVRIIELCGAEQVNIGADSKGHHLPEPSKEKLLALIDELKKFTVIDQKRNLTRLLV